MPCLSQGEDPQGVACGWIGGWELRTLLGDDGCAAGLRRQALLRLLGELARAEGAALSDPARQALIDEIHAKLADGSGGRDASPPSQRAP